MQNMEYIKIIVTVILAVAGWSVANYFAQQRDVKNKQRELRLSALEGAYKAFVRLGINGVMLYRDSEGRLVDGAKEIEDAVAVIHLYGTQEQSRLASKYAEEVATSSGGALTDLVNSIRAEIRCSLGGQDLEQFPKYLQVAAKDRVDV